jgi:hypothetical protein
MFEPMICSCFRVFPASDFGSLDLLALNSRSDPVGARWKNLLMIAKEVFYDTLK